MPSLKLPQNKIKLPQNKVAKGGVLSCLGCLGLIVLFFVLAIIAGIITAFTGGSQDDASNKKTPTATATSITASPSPTTASPTPTSASPSPTQSTATAVALEDEKNAIAAPASDTSEASGSQEAIEKLETLEVKGRAPKTGYSREQFGEAWEDVDHNGCDTRNDILRRDLTSITVKPGTRGCKVMTGVLNDPYTATTINFHQGKNTSSAIQIDHVVALSDAWQTGAQDISVDDRRHLANDPENLLAVDGPTNQQKSDGDAATWLPSNTAYRCTYVSKQIDVKAKYPLWVKQAEKEAMIRVLSNCGASLPTQAEEPAPVVEETTQAPVPTQAPEPVATQPAYVAPPVEQAPAQQAPVAQSYANCAEVRAAGAAPLYAGQPGYASHLDGDGDGVACERKK